MKYHWVLIVFGIFLILTGLKMIFQKEKQLDPGDNLLIRLLRKLLPLHPKLEGDNFFVKLDSVWKATPLFVALVFIELTDIIFAVDSVPAIFAVTKEPFVVFTSNIFAILGLRSLYFMLADVVDRFYLLKFGLAAVLIFVGCKMAFLNEMFDGKFPILWSLGIIVSFILVSIVLSLSFPKKSLT